MPYVTAFEEARLARNPIDVHGQTYHLSPYVGTAPARGTYVAGNEQNDDGLPQGFLVEQPAGATTPPHFHDHEQFQVVVAGSGHFGKQAANPISVHYAGGHTPYGPIIAGAGGLVYFTLRARWDAGAKYMPASRAKLKPVPRKHRLASGIVLPDEAACAAGGVSSEMVLDVAADGTCACIYRVGPGETAELTTPTPAGGQYALVLTGSILEDGRSFGLLSGLYRFRREPPLSVTAGPGGAALLLMQFSRDDPA